ncbi:MAG: hypothetical protein L0K86_24645 [Actinomycetia bacterium]|nr:hypothetical protein [Actinomycetes bacterium]
MRALASRAGDLVVPVLFACYAGGLLVSAFTQLDPLRTALVGDHALAPAAALVLVVAVSVLAWRSLARRRWMWLPPAELTWRDRGEQRVRVVRRRLVVAWGWRLAGVGYAWALAAALTRVPTAWWIVGTAVTVAVAVAVLVALWPAPPRRAELVEGWRERGVRVVAVRFLDPLLLVSVARPVTLSLAGASLVRFLALEGLDRGAGAIHAAVLLLVAMALLQLAPAVPVPAVLAALAHLATLPAASGLARVWHRPGLRRWIPVTDRRLRVTTGLLVAVVAGVWCAVAVAIAGVPAGPFTIGAVAVLVAIAVVRAVARPPVVVHHTSAVLLVLRTLRGLDVLAVGAVVLAALG